MGISGAELLVRCFESYKIPYIFTVPGAAIDPILDVLIDHGPKIILCRHEQNAAFMAQCWGRLTGQPGVCLATAGPGLTNLVTGVATADAERCPVIAITGQVSQQLGFKRAHQNIDSVRLFDPICKWSFEANHVDTLPDLFANAYRTASEPREGATHISIPVNLLTATTTAVCVPPIQEKTLGIVESNALDQAAAAINKAELPVLFLGLAASKPHIAQGVRRFLEQHPLPVVSTFEAAGTVSHELVDNFMGRLGLFRNQPGDAVLAAADAIIAVGYDLVEYDPSIWNKDLWRPIIHIDETPTTVDQSYQPTFEFVGDIEGNLTALGTRLQLSRQLPKLAITARDQLNKDREAGASLEGAPVHPLRLIYEISQFVDDQTTVISDVGSHQYWMARYFFCYEPQHFLTSMGFQTMGVALPWAIATTLARPGHKVLSVSGDGSFLMSSMELETAVRLQTPIVHMVWEDASYNLVKIQQEQKYGRSTAIAIGKINTVGYAEAMGAKGMRISHSREIRSTLNDAFSHNGPVVISVPIDYSDNHTIVDQQSSAAAV